jgi:hypothetical protein
MVNENNQMYVNYFICSRMEWHGSLRTSFAPNPPPQTNVCGYYFVIDS